jgi:hypothetical protein
MENNEENSQAHEIVGHEIRDETCNTWDEE